jgi:NAD(P)-dependent dehydrogenase (short-subunit alcohol dehydrogenase family)
MMNMPKMVKQTDTVIVTGSGGTGCGRAIAARFARKGAAVVVSDINEERGRETVSVIEAAGGRAAFFRADVRDEAQVRELIAFGEKIFDGVSVLVNNASGPYRPDQPLEHWADVVQTELVGAMYATRWAIDAMRRRGGGAIVNMTSISGLWHGRKNAGGVVPAYDAAKAGLIRLTTGLASLAQSDRIRVNCLAPGWIATEGPREYWESLTPAQRLERGVPSTLLSTEAVAAAVDQLASDPALSGRVLVWWSEDRPCFIRWGDRGYADTEDYPVSSDTA